MLEKGNKKAYDPVEKNVGYHESEWECCEPEPVVELTTSASHSDRWPKR